MGGLPKGSDAKKCIDALCSEFGWSYEPTEGGSAHAAGVLKCGFGQRGGCWKSVNGTAQNTAKKVWKFALGCTHGYSPSRRHW